MAKEQKAAATAAKTKKAAATAVPSDTPAPEAAPDAAAPLDAAPEASPAEATPEPAPAAAPEPVEPPRPAKKGDPIVVRFRDHIGYPTERTFSIEAHGDDYAEVAKQFCTKHATRLIR